MSQDSRPAGWRARWIWSPGRTARPCHFAYFRKTFRAGRGVRRGRVRCAADSRYRLWLNGAYVGSGPARGHPEHPYYDTHAVTLTGGVNTVAVVVQHYASPPAIFASVRGGLLCQIDAGGTTLAATDRSWRALASAAYRTLAGYIYPQAFDARAEPEGWEQGGFDDAAWPQARHVGAPLAPPEALRPRPIPNLTDTRIEPRTVLAAGLCFDDRRRDLTGENDVAESLWRCRLAAAPPGVFSPALGPYAPWPRRPLRVRLAAGQAAYLTLDFGAETLAAVEIAARAPAGVILDIGYSECLLDNRVATRWQNGRLSERIVLRAGRTRHRMSQPRGFRYVMLRVANRPGRRAAEVVLEDVAAHEAVYPARPRGRFRADDPLLERIYRLSARTVNLCMEDAFTDCPWRERSQWVGDVQPEALFAYYCFGAYDLARKAVLEFASGTTGEGWLPCVFPATRNANLPTWGMRFPVIAWEYYLHTGDRDALGALYDGVRRQMRWLAGYEDRRGLAVGLPGWRFVDWTCLDVNANDGAVQGWYLEALQCSAKLARAVGDADGASDFTRRARRLRDALGGLYWSKARRAFLKYRPGSPVRPPQAHPDLIGQHENFLFPLLKVGTPAMRRQALDAVAGSAGLFLPDLGEYQSAHRDGQSGTYAGEKILRIGTPFWSFYALAALMEAGRTVEALDYMRIGWGLMLDAGATSCWEMWDRNSSLCHGWSAAPAMILPAYVLGVRPTRPGFARFEVRPRPGDLRWARGRVPTPRGDIRVGWERRGDGLACEVTVPDGARATLVPPGPGAERTDLPPGRHTVKVPGGPACRR